MSDVANPEVLLFASTTQSFLEKEVPLSRLRELLGLDDDQSAAMRRLLGPQPGSLDRSAKSAIVGAGQQSPRIVVVQLAS